MADQPENLVLLQLQGMRREMAALLDRQLRDRELIAKVYNEVLSLRSEIRELKSDFVTLENQMQNRHNEVLGVIRRLDALGVPPD
ncbi:MAG: hypothetical protein ACREET_11275 [Stellaceae bacterium]